MSRLFRLALLTLAALTCVPAIQAAAAPAPWWGVETGARPTNLWDAQSEVQELRAAPVGKITLVELNGVKVACMGSNSECTAQSMPNTESAGELQNEALTAAYGPGGVEVTETPTGSRRFQIRSTGPMAGRWVPKLETSSQGASLKVLAEGGSGRLVLTLTNLGDAPVQGSLSPVTVTDVLPAGVLAYHAEAIAGMQDISGPVNCSVAPGGGTEVSCTFAQELAEYEAIEVEVWVSLNAPLPGTPGEVKVSGGGAAPASVAQSITVSEERVGFGVESFSIKPEEEGGAADSTAGTHPFQLTTALQLNAGPVEPGKLHVISLVEQPALPRNFRFPLPSGLVGNPTAYPTCTYGQFTHEHALINDCPPESAVGVASVTAIAPGIVGFVRTAVPVFNLEAAPGEPARFGILPVGVPVTIDTAIDADHEYRISAISSDAPQTAELLATTVTLWGNPGDPRHDSARGWNCAFARATEPCLPPVTHTEAPFLRLPVSCAKPLAFGMALEPWNVPIGSDVETSSYEAGAIGNCAAVPFHPAISAVPTSERAGTTTGLDFGLELPDPWFEEPGPAEAEPKKIEVTLPEGMTANPAQAAGLGVCTPAEFAKETATSAPGEGCPLDSKIGTVTAHTPLLEEPIEGSLFVAAPHDNPFNSLLALYLVAKVPDRGVLVKQAGSVEPDPRTGQLHSTFDQIPQLPFSEFHVHFRGGNGAPLVAPPACGNYEAVARMVPWSAVDPGNPSPGELAEAKAPFSIGGGGPDGGPCPTGVPPLHPGFSAGSQSNSAGAYSPFNVHISRSDGEQEVTGFSVTLPPGLIGKLAGIPYCSDGAIASARSREHDGGAAEELASPSCPSASQVGVTEVGAGVGSTLVYVPGKLYLAGPYNGAPLSVVAITPAQVGPFDVGTVVIREALRVDPITAQVSISSAGSDPLPRIIDGIPVHLRDIRAYTNRPEFTLNPTDCEPSSTSATVNGLGDGSGPSSNADPQSATSSVYYQVGNCAALGFKPKLQISLKGSTKRTGHPALKAILTYPKGGGYANIARAQVNLPHSEFIEQNNLNKTCTKPVLLEGKCPAKSIYGKAKAWSPLLDKPLEGPVYLVGGFGYKLPALVAELNGQIRVVLAGKVDSGPNKGIRNTFEAVPDAPVEKFVLEMKGGPKYSLLVNSENLCKKPQKAIARFTAQNGKVLETKPAIANDCKKKSKGGGKKHKKSTGGKKKTGSESKNHKK